jgi:cytochrome oxidase Cu insertion factor (SCO1/SenC/PrrC family)
VILTLSPSPPRGERAGVRRLLLACAVALVAAAPPAAAAEPDWASFGAVAYEPPKSAPAFSLPDLDGRAVALADLRGKVTLVFFWATW